MGVTAIWPGVWPTPVTEFVELPPLLVKITFVVTVPSPVGVNRTTTLVALKPAKLNAPPETMLNGAPTVATPLLNGAPPALVTRNVALAFVPTRTIPRFVLAGVTTICAGVTPMPVTALVEPPALAVAKTTLELKVPALAGVKRMMTLVEP